MQGQWRWVGGTKLSQEFRLYPSFCKLLLGLHGWDPYIMIYAVSERRECQWDYMFKERVFQTFNTVQPHILRTPITPLPISVGTSQRARRLLGGHQNAADTIFSSSVAPGLFVSEDITATVMRPPTFWQVCKKNKKNVSISWVSLLSMLFGTSFRMNESDVNGLVTG